jgi:hypothetical protein
MVPTVIADDVSGRGEGANDFGFLGYEAPQYKKCHLHIVPGKHF